MSRLERLEKFVVQNQQGERFRAQWVVIYRFLPDGKEEMTEAYVELETGEHLHVTLDNNSFYDRRKLLKYVRTDAEPSIENVKFRKSMGPSG